MRARRQAILMCSIGVLALHLLVGSALAQVGAQAPGEVLVRFKEGVREAQQVRRTLNAQGTPIGALPELNVVLLRLRPGLAVDDAIRDLSARPDVVYAEPNFRRQTTATPNDQYYPLQYGLPRIQADLAWSAREPVSSVTIAILDTGISYTHGDLANKMWINPGEIPGNGIDDDGDGFVDNIYGANIVYNNGNPNDDHYHGTHVAGIAAAQINNGIGVAGVAGWNGNPGQTDTNSAKLMAVKVLDSQGSGWDAGVAAGIIFAANKGAKIINMSLGGPDYSQTLNDACQYAWNRGCIVIAAAGNSGSSSFSYPAAFPNVISVAATDANDRLTWFSNWGAWVKTAAPGVDIASTFPGNSYVYMSGTSMATPFVAGEAALVWSCFPSLTKTQLRDAILNNTDPYLPYNSRTIGAGAGRINVLKALNAAAAVNAPAQPANLRAYAGNALVVLTWDVVPEAGSYNVKRRLQGEGGFSTIATGVASTTFRDSGLTNGVAAEYKVSAVNAGIEGEDSSPAAATPSAAILINSGGPEYLHSSLRVFSADQYFSGGTIGTLAPRPIGSTSDPTLYFTRRAANSFSYSLPVPRGEYRIRLHFAEYWSIINAGDRPMRVLVNGQVALPLVDVMAEVPRYTALVKEIIVVSPTNTLTVQVQALGSSAAFINAVEIERIGPFIPAAPTNLTAIGEVGRIALSWNPSPNADSYNIKRSLTSGGPYTTVASGVQAATYLDTTALVGVTYYYVVSAVADGEGDNSNEASAAAVADAMRINAGGPAYQGGSFWSADQYFQGGAPGSMNPRPIGNTSDPTLYFTRRAGSNFTYTVPAPAGNYVLRLHFAEYWTAMAPGTRPMEVRVNNAVVIPLLDVLAEVPIYTALVKTLNVSSVNGQVVVNLRQIGSSAAFINAIELVPVQ